MLPPFPPDGRTPQAPDASRPGAVAAPAVPWLSWSAEAFARARTARRPVLLWVMATWSDACGALARDVFGDPALARLIGEATVPVRVDADRRPDIAERYTQGGWPTVLLLTPEGDPLAGGTYVDAAALATLIAGAASALETRREELARRAHAWRTELADVVAAEAHADAGATANATPAGEPGAPDARLSDAEAEEDLAWIADHLLAAFDRDHGGFGTDAKFPLAAPIAFALWRGTRTEDERLIDAALVTLDRMAAGGLSAADGAFHRACGARDWSAPDEAKLLETQAELIPVYLDAWALTGDDAYRTRAEAAIAFVFRALAADPARGGFFASQAPDGSIDRVRVIDANAKMIAALVHAGRTLADASLVERAAETIERVIPPSYLRRAGVAHLLVPVGGDRADVPQVRGLLADQVHASAALLDAGIAVAEPAYVELAEELMRSAIRKLWHPAGGFVDRLHASAGAGDVGLLAMPLRPFATNAAAARVLLRLGRDAERPDLLASADVTLRSLRAVYRRHDVLGAELGLALLTRVSAF